jgi:hypothetical protein
VFFYIGVRFTNHPSSHLTLVLIPVAIFIYLTCFDQLKIKRAEFFVLAVICLLLLVSGFFVYTPLGVNVSPAAFAASLVLFCSCLVARSLVILNLDYYFSLATFWLVALPSIWLVCNGDSASLKMFFIGSSENFVSSWLIVSAVAVITTGYRARKAYILYPAIIALVVSYFLYTRASIAVALILLFSIVFFRFGLKKTLLLCLGSVVLFFFSDLESGYSFLNYFIDNTKFGSQGIESPRWMLWEAYFRDMNIISFLIGTDLSYIPEIGAYSNNPHNSLIRFHAMFGVVPMFFLIGIVFYIIKRSSFYSVMILIFLARASTDIILFGVYLDVLLMLVVLSSIYDHIDPAQKSLTPV